MNSPKKKYKQTIQKKTSYVDAWLWWWGSMNVYFGAYFNNKEQ